MAHWIFWEWVAYGALFTAAIGLAVDTSIRQSDTLKMKFGWLIEKRIWGFAPIVLMTVGTVIFVAKLVSGPDNVHSVPQSAQEHAESSEPKPAAVEAPPGRTKGPYDDLSNNDLRLLARELAARIDMSWRLYLASKDAAEKATEFTDRAQLEIKMEESLSRGFRGDFAVDVVAVAQEIAERTDNSDLRIEITDGLLSPGTILSFQRDLIRASRELP
jgi:hypothetical protein